MTTFWLVHRDPSRQRGGAAYSKVMSSRRGSLSHSNSSTRKTGNHMSQNLMLKNTQWSPLTTVDSCRPLSWTPTSSKTSTLERAVKSFKRQMCRTVSLGPASLSAPLTLCPLTRSGERTENPSATCSSKRICFTWWTSSSSTWMTQVTNGRPRSPKRASLESIYRNNFTSFSPAQWTMFASRRTTFTKNSKWTSTIILRKHSLRRKSLWMKLCIIWSYSVWQASRKRWWIP